MLGKLKPVENSQISGETIYTCPLCGKIVVKGRRRCKECKQRLNWKKIK